MPKYLTARWPTNYLYFAGRRHVNSFLFYF
jgi:hypothetical protein